MQSVPEHNVGPASLCLNQDVTDKDGSKNETRPHHFIILRWYTPYSNFILARWKTCHVISVS